uniref:Uncharacterized protein n=1 Tax=Arundo donax TaxID=35708 RepID=A0A0A9AAQ3_ARUDO
MPRIQSDLARSDFGCRLPRCTSTAVLELACRGLGCCAIPELGRPPRRGQAEGEDARRLPSADRCRPPAPC